MNNKDFTIEEIERSLYMKYILRIEQEYKRRSDLRNILGDLIKEAIAKSIQSQKQKIIEEILRLLKLKIVCRTRGLTLDIHNQESKDFYIGARKELEEFYRHIADLDLKYLIADIECAKKYLDTEEIKEFEELLKSLGEK